MSGQGFAELERPFEDTGHQRLHLAFVRVGAYGQSAEPYRKPHDVDATYTK